MSNPADLIATFDFTGKLHSNEIQALLADEDERRVLVDFLTAQPNQAFARAFLQIVIELRKQVTVDIEGLMFACYLVALHSCLEDAALVWQVKNLDFDSYCGVDVQLVVFAGVERTIVFFREQPGFDKAVQYLEECAKAGDFADLAEYYSPANRPWWL